MKLSKSYFLLICFLLLVSSVFAQNQQIQQSQQAQQQEQEKIASFTKTFNELFIPEEIYNLGVGEFYKGEFVNAAKCFAKSASETQDLDLRFKSMYNLGNVCFKQGDYDSAINAYNSALEIKKDLKAEFNLKVAEKKKKEQEQQQQQNQQQDGQSGENKQDGQQQQDGQSGENKQDGQQKQDGQSGENKQDGQQKQDGQSGENKQDGQQKQDGQSGENKQDGQQKQDGQSGENKQDGQQKQDGQSDENKNDGQQTGDNKEGNNSKESGSQSESRNGNDSNNEQKTKNEEVKQVEEQHADVDMSKLSKAEQGTISEKEVSQKAKAMKNIKANPYMIQKLLKDMEEREARLQQQGRNEGQPQRRRSFWDDDFMNMDADEINDFMMHRGRQAAPNSDEPDW